VIEEFLEEHEFAVAVKEFGYKNENIRYCSLQFWYNRLPLADI